MQANAPFGVAGTTQNLAVTASNQYLALTGGGDASSLRIVNIGTQTVFLLFGTGTVAATVANAVPLLAGVIEVFAIGPSVTSLAMIAATTGSTVYVTPGYGN